jgi:hypothetical protein
VIRRPALFSCRLIPARIVVKVHGDPPSRQKTNFPFRGRTPLRATAVRVVRRILRALPPFGAPGVPPPIRSHDRERSDLYGSGYVGPSRTAASAKKLRLFYLSTVDRPRATHIK